MRKYTILLIIAFVTLNSCKDDEGINIPSGELLSFAFNTTLNDISINSTSKISGNIVIVFLPPLTDISNLISEFQVSDSVEVLVNNIIQISSVKRK